MNCEAYIAYYWNGQINLYPNNIDTEIFADMFTTLPEEENEPPYDLLAIKRKGEMVYYAFSVPLDGSPKDKVCLTVALNNILLTDIPTLNSFMRNCLRELADNHRIARYEENRGGYAYINDSNDIPTLSVAQELLRTHFNERFDGYGTRPGAMDYANNPGIDVFTLLQNGRLRHRLSVSTRTGNSLQLRQSIEAGNTVLIQSRDESALRIAELISQLKEEKQEHNYNQEDWDRQESAPMEPAPPVQAPKPIPNPDGDSFSSALVAFCVTVLCGMVSLYLYFH